MDEATFWSLIDRFDWSKEEDDDIIEPAVVALALLPDSQIADFQEILARKLYALDGRAWARNSGSAAAALARARAACRTVAATSPRAWAR